METEDKTQQSPQKSLSNLVQENVALDVDVVDQNDIRVEVEEDQVVEKNDQKGDEIAQE